MYQDWTPEQLRKHGELVKRGKLTHMLHPKQREVVDYIKNHPEINDFGIYACRKIGKTFMLSIFGWEFCEQNPGVVVRHILPTLKNAKEVVIPVMNELMGMIPKEYHPEFFSTNAEYRFKNGSKYILCGSSTDSLDSARGPRCDVLMFDEVAFSEERSYDNAQNSVFKPQQTLVKRAIRIYATTPPRSPDHPFIIQTVPKIQAQGAFFKFTVYDNPLLTPAQVQKLKDDYGEESNAWKREYMAEIVVDDSWRIVPEFNDKLDVIEKLPEAKDMFGLDVLYRGYRVGDIGVGDQDFTGMLTGYFDHINQEVVITGESLMHKPTITTIALEWERMGRTYLTKHTEVVNTLDGFAQLTNSLRIEHGLQFLYPKKGKVQDNIAFLRTFFENRRIKVLASCPRLIEQLKNGIWKENKKDFERSDTLGHLDLLICLVYLVRAVDWKYRPGQSNVNLRLGTKKEPEDARKEYFRNLR